MGRGDRTLIVEHDGSFEIEGFHCVELTRDHVKYKLGDSPWMLKLDRDDLFTAIHQFEETLQVMDGE